MRDQHAQEIVAESSGDIPSKIPTAVFHGSGVRHRTAAVVLLLCLLSAAPAHAQTGGSPRFSPWWSAAGGALVTTALLDGEVRTWSQAHQSAALDRLATAGNALGTGRVLVPTMVAVGATSYLAGAEEITGAMLRIGAAYTAGNAIVSVLKPVVGRHRPGERYGAWSFQPLTLSGGEWHSFPSAHTIHAFSIAAAVAEEVDRPWVTFVAFGAAGVVGWSRVYEDKHWASDVVAAAVFGSWVGYVIPRWMRRQTAEGEAPGGIFRIRPTPGGMMLDLSIAPP